MEKSFHQWFQSKVEFYVDIVVPNDADILTAQADTDGLAQLLYSIRTMRARLAHAEDYVQSELLGRMEADDAWELEVPGIPGPVVRHSGRVRLKWDHDGATEAMVHAIAGEQPEPVFTESGEFVDFMELVRQVIKRYRVAATPSWKVTGLRQFGLKAKDYCDEQAGPANIETPKIQLSTVGVGGSPE